MEGCLSRVLKGEAPRDVFLARGHVNITATNRQTLEITKDPYVTRRGDCIVACCAEKAAGELRRDVLQALASRGVVLVVIEAGDVQEVVTGETPGTMPTSRWRIVVRRSRYVDDSTVAIAADKAAADLDRSLVERLRRGAPVRVTVGVCTYL
ncbi:MAG: DUF371 domain-containing protein [Pyrobaculum sp.]|nr:DUF371 domain-containing protein [Pyrobaculum sp.]